jgi:hypothetical protein
MEALNALRCYHVLIGSVTEVPDHLQHLMLSRMLDQLAIISQLEIESKVSPNSDVNWDSLPPGKLKLREDSLSFLTLVLRIHMVWLKTMRAKNTLETQSLLFWCNLGYMLSNLEF